METEEYNDLDILNVGAREWALALPAALLRVWHRRMEGKRRR